ncbi:MAG TPA: ergothioneine biosynthesis protein EgtC [Pseudonocardiaceae bacterium]|jgi:glutamine amidotransferase|nr:ergothioneine biosynthesis protein EgtC [Pseudonocardiaceae bacterium]
MCRHLAYLGSPVSLAALLIDPPHSLLRQSWAPTDMRGGGTINADGFGAGWYPTDRPEPVGYRRATPMWSDTGFADLAGTITTGCALAAVRSATVGMPVTESASAPFAGGRWLFSHNGVVRGWPDSMAALAAGLPVVDLLTMDAPTDAALLWALLRHRLAAGQEPEDALAALVTDVADAAPDSRLNLLLTDGETVLATAWGHALSVLTGPDRSVIASEPWDTDPGWRAVSDRQLVIADRSGLTVHDL